MTQIYALFIKGNEMRALKLQRHHFNAVADWLRRKGWWMLRAQAIKVNKK